ncbi:hypothetical protein IW261DRAFT_1615863 [Armillaria novae-zelandiae]|uniref:Uncharacterized protein n=1 Tax=Armillaria novae-zelandiae TaxID=153914 RepID=A0AA39N5A5_9AGAR|nr:hypothetical protein IW261DRAFT_1615863 [Armillaria novae-zelandiae]
MGMIADFCFRPSVEQWMESMGEVRAPVTVYVAEKGARLLPVAEEEREDLGASRWVPGARVVRVPGGHMDFLEHELVIAGLQEGVVGLLEFYFVDTWTRMIWNEQRGMGCNDTEDFSICANHCYFAFPYFLCLPSNLGGQLDQTLG